MGERSVGVWVAGAVVLIAAGVAVWRLVATSDVRPASPPESVRVGHATPLRVEPHPANQPAAPIPPAAAAGGAGPGAQAAVPPDAPAEMPKSLGNVDLEEVRKQMPDNLYWKMSSPTHDPQVQAERDAERARWNDEYGKVLSGTATEDEIRAYYDRRARLSGDYIEFATYLVDHYNDQISDQDLELLHLAIRLHRARLEEIPRKVEEAFERKRQQDAARAAWLADQADFGAADNDSQ